MMERYYSQMGHDSRHGVVCHRMLNGDMHCLNEPTRPQRRSPLRASVGSLRKWTKKIPLGGGNSKGDSRW
jgi:hypothetical protein